jgi:hypothetical protein
MHLSYIFADALALFILYVTVHILETEFSLCLSNKESGPEGVWKWSHSSTTPELGTRCRSENPHQFKPRERAPLSFETGGWKVPRDCTDAV